MPAFGKPNATGRSSGKLTGRERKIFGPPEGQPWVWQTQDLLESDAWQDADTLFGMQALSWHAEAF